MEVIHKYTRNKKKKKRGDHTHIKSEQEPEKLF